MRGEIPGSLPCKRLSWNKITLESAKDDVPTHSIKSLLECPHVKSDKSVGMGFFFSCGERKATGGS